jgi:hypothetical protein
VKPPALVAVAPLVRALWRDDVPGYLTGSSRVL